MARQEQCITLDEVWGNLLDGIEQLFQFQTIRYSKWMLLYTYIFDYCTKNSDVKGADLYEKLRDYLRNYLENLCQSNTTLPDQEILEFYTHQWKKYCISCKILHGICSYIHRHYIKRAINAGNTNIHETYPMAMEMWQQVVFRLFYTKIINFSLNLIKAERNQEKIDTETIHNIIQTYITSSINQHGSTSDTRSQVLDVYQEYFEDQFLQDTQEFYQQKATIYLQRNSVMDYISLIHQYFDEEVHRAVEYLHPSSVKNLTRKLEEVLIIEQLQSIDAEAKILVHDEKIPELNLVYQTVHRIENGTDKLKNMIENHIYQIGIETDLKIYIESIYNLHQKYLTFIQKAFDNHHEFIDIFNRTCRKFINDNLFIQTIGNPISMVKHLAHYCDKLLRKEKEETNIEIAFHQIKILLYYMHEKDVFVNVYSKLLAKRLINKINISNDHEQLMISTIATTCGFGFAYKMKQMCQNIEISETILVKYNQYCENQQVDHKINFSVMILNSNTWSFSTPSNIILPNKLETILNNFNMFYKNLHNGRKLTWLHQHSKGELQTFFTQKVHKLRVSTYQMVILLLFNDSLEWTVEQIHDQTQITIDLLISILNALVQSKILTCTQFLHPTNFDMNCKVKLSNDFKSDKYHINLNTGIQSTEEKNMETFQTKIDQDRIMIIRTTIVRTMKLHQTMLQNVLIQTIIEQLSSHFNPDISTIKGCINSLITKEYLEINSHNKDLLSYIA
ncbi:unnamed protein product [Rotaria socialis]|uniref:Cullin family profile domain-containing protein n=1 Tax=Rotaria socialis TaxID=392032 RepID=A0A818N2I1_9BILA|nr:unnamed protein product [Rotaria socialis]